MKSKIMSHGAVIWPAANGQSNHALKQTPSTAKPDGIASLHGPVRAFVSKSPTSVIALSPPPERSDSQKSQTSTTSVAPPSLSMEILGQPVQTTPAKLAEIIGKPTKLVLFLDYDGTLMEDADPLVSTANESLKQSLQTLSRQADVHVVVISGRDYEAHIQAIPDGLGVHRVANHGGDFLPSGQTQWQSLVPPRALAKWMPAAQEDMQAFVNDNPAPASDLEVKRRGLAMHCNTPEVEARAKVLVASLRAKLEPYDVLVEQPRGLVEVRENGVAKGKALGMVLKELLGDHPPEGTKIIAAGDSGSDETMFKALADNAGAVTIRVGPGNSDGRWRLSNPAQVRDLLSALAAKY